MMNRYARPALISLALLASGCADAIVGDGPADAGLSDFESAWKTVHDVYPYLQFKKINWDSIHAAYLPRARSAQGDEIFPVLFDLLRELKDGHTQLIPRGGLPTVNVYMMPRYERDKNAYDPLVVRRYFSTELRLAGNQHIEYEILPGNVAYVHFSVFAEGSWVDEFSAVLDYVRLTKGMILDLRLNPGGDGETGDKVVARFIAAPLPQAPVYALGQLLHWGPILPAGPYTYTQPVVVLINGTSASMAEAVAEMMTQRPGVILAGDTTAGMGGSQTIFDLPSGRKIRISTKDLRRYDDQPIEWNGVPPDTCILQTEADVKGGRDRQLEYALQALLGNPPLSERPAGVPGTSRCFPWRRNCTSSPTRGPSPSRSSMR
ncbi:MAG TPA: S41 family peptidase [Bacteroidota bacterium]|nr:S41 family peptidase [Bacteroidota bacterium]